MSPLRCVCTTLLAALLLTPLACGSQEDLTERGIETQPEESVPVDPTDLAETEEERRKKNIEALQAAERGVPE